MRASPANRVSRRVPACSCIRRTDPLGNITSTQITDDATGNLTQLTDAKGNKVTLTYDATKRRTQETHTPLGGNTPSRTITYTYNAVGQLTGYTDAPQEVPLGDSNNGHADHLTHSASVTLDALNRKTSENITLGSQSITLGTSYAATGKKSSQTWPQTGTDSTQITYAWDDAQRLKNIQIPDAGTLSTQTFDAWNQPQSQLYPGGSTRTQDSDGFARLSRIRVKSPSQVSLMQRGYTYDAESNITAIATEQGDNQYQYDALYRLTNVTTGISGLPGEQYTYDSLGNRLTDKRRPNPNQGDKSWRYNGNNQLTESATEDNGILFSNSKAVTHTFDANGSLLQKTTPAGSQGQYPTDNQKYHYDAQNRLTEVQDQNGNTIASTQYDPLGRRIRKTIHRSWDGSAWTALAQAQTNTYYYADEGLAAEYKADGNNAPQLISQVGWQPDGLWGTNPVWIKTTKQGASQAEFFYYQNDHLGTPQTIIDGQGQVVWRMKATAFGETSVDPASMIANNLRFPGQYYDAETNTHYNYFRDYDPPSGRYWQGDPIGLDGGANLFVYVKMSPIRFVDPKGLTPTICRGTDCVDPPFDTTPEGPRPAPQAPQPSNPQQKGKCHPLVEWLLGGCTCAETNKNLPACKACCLTAGGFNRSAGSMCQYECEIKFNPDFIGGNFLPGCG